MTASSGPAGEHLADVFEEQRSRLRSIAVRVLGSESDADDVVQDAWLRLEALGPDGRREIVNLPAWLTTVVSRLSLNSLRSRSRRRVEALPEPGTAEPAVTSPGPEASAERSADVELALLVLMEHLGAEERVTLVLHDVFGVPFVDVAVMLGRTVDAVRQLASRARRRIRLVPTPVGRQTAPAAAVVDAFFTAGRLGDLTGLVAVLAPNVVLRVDAAQVLAPHRVEGAVAVATRAHFFASPSRRVDVLALTDRPAALVSEHGRRVSLMVFTITDGRIASIDVLADAERLDALDLTGAGL